LLNLRSRASKTSSSAENKKDRSKAVSIFAINAVGLNRDQRPIN
jgi:hypothetical protein